MCESSSQHAFFKRNGSALKLQAKKRQSQTHARTTDVPHRVVFCLVCAVGAPPPPPPFCPSAVFFKTSQTLSEFSQVVDKSRLCTQMLCILST